MVIPDDKARVFHPTEGGHALIANLVLFKMREVSAKRKGDKSFPPEQLEKNGNGWPVIVGPSCSTDSSNTWAGRDAMIDAVKNFCAVPSNLKGSTGLTTSEVYNEESFDYMNVSTTWESDKSSIVEQGCFAWLDNLANGCDGDTGSPKHGGAIAYRNNAANAILRIEPLTMQRLWDGGNTGGQQCHDISSNNYMDTSALQASIEDFCGLLEEFPGGIAESGFQFTREFNQGLPEHVYMHIKWPYGQKAFQIFGQECRYYMSVLNNGCSLPNDASPMNWKHGGNLTDHNGILYTLEPAAERPPSPSSPRGSCKASANIFHYQWQVSGGGFSGPDVKAALHKHTRDCGAITAWKFKYYDEPSEDGTEWHASGTLPWTIPDHCVARAVKRAGGFESRC